MKILSISSLTTFIFSPLLLFPMSDEQKKVENQICVQDNVPKNQNDTPLIQRFTMTDTGQSKNAWVWNNPYQDDDCNYCRIATSGTSLGIGGVCAIIKGTDVLCTTCTSSQDTCGEVCGRLWLPLGYDNWHYGCDACCSVTRWAITVSMILSPIVSACTWNPFCTKNGLELCCKKITINSNNPLNNQQIPMQKKNDN